jgi:heme exporter protein D
MSLTFQFSDLAAFLWMNGHGPYVWGCYAVTLMGVAFLILEPGLAKKRFIQAQQQVLKRKTQGTASVSSPESIKG